jgi:dTDP-4-dehydrorhamnose 3,5-epimerase-like enzyme
VDVRVIPFASNVDPRGSLTAIEEGAHVPFPIRRVFLVHDVDSGAPRGGHAHLDTDQVLVAVHGELDVHVTDGFDEATFRLSGAATGLYVPRMLWVDLLDFSAQTVLMVLASTVYDPARSIRTWPEYQAVVGVSGPATT